MFGLAHVYSIAVAGGYGFVVDGVPAITLGHGVEGHAVLSHPFYGTPRVLADVEAWVRANPSVVLQAPPSLLPDPLTARVTTLETTVAEHAAFIAKLKADLAKP